MKTDRDLLIEISQELHAAVSAPVEAARKLSTYGNPVLRRMKTEAIMDLSIKAMDVAASVVRRILEHVQERPPVMTAPLVAPGSRIESGDLVIDSSSAEVNGFAAGPDRVILRFDGFDVYVPDAAAANLLHQLRAKMSISSRPK